MNKRQRKKRTTEDKKLSNVLCLQLYRSQTDKITLDLYDKLIREIDKLKVKTRPRRRKGQWIGTEYDGYADGCPVYDTFECSECGWEHYGEEDTLTNYCSNCGAKMKQHLIVQQEREDQMDWIRLIKAMLIGILAIGNIWILINIFDSDVYAYIFLAECLIAIFIFIVWIAYHAIG